MCEISSSLASLKKQWKILSFFSDATATTQTNAQFCGDDMYDLQYKLNIEVNLSLHKVCEISSSTTYFKLSLHKLI